MAATTEIPCPEIFEHVAEGMLVLAPDGEVVDGNPAMCRYLGYSRDELIGLQLGELLAQPGEQALDAPPGTVGSPGGSQEEWAFRHKDGMTSTAGVTLAATPNGGSLCIIRAAAGTLQDEIQRSRLAAIVEASSDAIIGKDLNSIITSWNAGAEQIFGYTAQEMIGQSILKLIPPGREDEETHIIERIRRGEKVNHFETVRITRDRRLIDVSVTISPIRDAMGTIVGASKIARDITQAKTQEREMARMTRLYAALAQINQRIVRSGDPDTLFRSTCRLLIELGGMEMAWIGRLDAETRRLVPVARYGDSSGYLDRAEVYTDERPEAHGPAEIAFHSGHSYISNDMLEDPATVAWRREVAASGYRSCAAFPIKVNSRVEGTLAVYTGQSGFFHQEEVTLLSEVASDLAVALHGFTLEERRRKSEQVALSEKSFSDTMIESMPGIVVLFDEQGRMLRWNRNLLKSTGYTDEEVAAMQPSALFPTAEVPLMEQSIAEVFATGEATTQGTVRSKEGTQTPHLFSGRRLELDGKACVVGIGVDISQLKAYERQLQEQEAMYREMSAMAHVGAWKFDPDTGDGVWTEEVARIHGMAPEAETHADIGVSFYHGEHRRRIEAALAEAIEQGTPYDLELELVNAKGERRWVRTLSHPVVEHGKVVTVRGSIQDITDRKANEEKIRRLNRVLSVLSQINGLIVRVKDRGELFTEACRIATQAGQFRMAMLALVDPATGAVLPVASEGKDDALMADINRILSSSDLASTTMVATALKERRAVITNDQEHDPAVVFSGRYSEAGVRSIAVLPLVVADAPIGVLVLYATESEFFHEEEVRLLNELTHDIAFAVDHLDKQAQLSFLAYYDELTGLANRALFLERVGQFVRNLGAGQKLAVMQLDLERFKSINDALGRATGDALLIRLADWLKRNALDVNLLARIGSDHFTAAVPGLPNAGDAARLIEKTLGSMQQQDFVVDGQELRIGAKAGIALCPDDGTDAETLLMNAEAALKEAKRSGDRYLFYTGTMTASVATKLSLENRLRKAIEGDEFVLHYQPKVNLSSGKVTSAEALIRWNDPDEGVIPPAEFIPLLEETGLIQEVGRWVLKRSMEENLRWREAGRRVVPVAVNVSAQQLRNPDFISEIADKLRTDDVAAGNLELEITESVVMEDIKRSVSTLQCIREMGIRIAIDDFGTGFSSLSYLATLPVDTLKIDRSFVLNMTESREGLALVSTIINLAHSLGLKGTSINPSSTA